MNRLPALSVARLRIFAGLTIAAAAAISFESIRHLAVIGGFGTLAILFPLTLDAVAAYGMDLWVRRSPAARQAKWLALSAIFGSLVANVVDHWLTQRAVLGAVLGAVPPGMLAALLAVAHKHASGTEDQAVPFDPAVRDAVWSALPQADRRVVPPPDRYVVPSEVLALAVPTVGPLDAMADFRSHEDKFWSKVEMGGPEECWPFVGSRTPEGYGKFTIGDRTYRAHRIAWSIATNQVVSGDLMVRHLKCDNPPCCNPAHLAEGTAADNAADRVQRLAKLEVVQSLDAKIMERSTRRTSAARTPNPAVRRTTSATVHSDSDIVTWIKDQPSPTKRAVMAKYSVGSGRALRLISQAKEV
jgi:hypothetical protein